MDLDEVTQMDEAVQVDLRELDGYAVVFAADDVTLHLDTQQACMTREIDFQCARGPFRQPLGGFYEDAAKAYVPEYSGNE